MTYRLIVTLELEGRKSDFLLRNDDIGDLLKAKDFFINLALAMRTEPFTPDDGVRWLEAHYFPIDTTQVELTMWHRQEHRVSWIETYAEREYVVDMATGQVTQPQWSAKMDTAP